MKRYFTICVDMDDTIENLVYAWVDWLNKKHNLSVNVKDIISWDVKYAFPMLSVDEVFSPLSIREFWKTVAPKADAIIYLKKLIDDGHDVYICTCSHYETVQYKIEEVLNKYFPYIDWKHIIIMHDKQMIKCDIMVDDGPHNLEGGNYYKFLMTANHNKSYDEKENNMLRVNNWEEIYQSVKTLSYLI